MKKSTVSLLIMKGSWAIAGAVGAGVMGIYAVLRLVGRFLYLDEDDFSDE